MKKYARNLISFKQAITIVAAHFGCSRHAAEALFDTPDFPAASTASMGGVRVTGFWFNAIAKWLECHDLNGETTDKTVTVDVDAPRWDGSNVKLADGNRNPFADPVNYTECAIKMREDSENARRMCQAAGKDFDEFLNPTRQPKRRA